MTVTRQNVEIVVRSHTQAGFFRLQRRSLGSPTNMQRQCCSGELEFDRPSNKFVTIAKDKRRKFVVEEVEPAQIENIFKKMSGNSIIPTAA